MVSPLTPFIRGKPDPELHAHIHLKHNTKPKRQSVIMGTNSSSCRAHLVIDCPTIDAQRSTITDPSSQLLIFAAALYICFLLLV